MHFVDLLLHPFLECFLQLSIFTSSSTAEIICDNLISEAGLSKIYPPAAPLVLLTSFLFFNFIKFVLNKLKKYSVLKKFLSN